MPRRVLFSLEIIFQSIFSKKCWCFFQSSKFCFLLIIGGKSIIMSWSCDFHLETFFNLYFQVKVAVLFKVQIFFYWREVYNSALEVLFSLGNIFQSILSCKCSCFFQSSKFFCNHWSTVYNFDLVMPFSLGNIFQSIVLRKCWCSFQSSKVCFCHWRDVYKYAQDVLFSLVNVFQSIVSRKCWCSFETFNFFFWRDVYNQEVLFSLENIFLAIFSSKCHYFLSLGCPKHESNLQPFC